MDAVIAQARAEKEVTFAYGLIGGQPEIDSWRKGYARMYGYPVKLNAIPTTQLPPIISRIIEEQKAGRTGTIDVIGVSETLIIPLLKADALQRIDWSFAPNVQEDFVEADGRAVPFFTRIFGVTVNTDVVKEAEIPRTLEDVLRTKYSVATSPFGAGFLNLAHPTLWGEERTLEFMRKLSRKASGFINCGQTNRLLTGEFDIFALDCGTMEALGRARRGAPLRSVIMKDAPVLGYIYLVVPRNAPNPAGAKLLINYLLSRDGQDVLYNYDFTDYHRIPGSHTRQQIADANKAGVELREVNIAFALEMSDRAEALREKMQDILRRQ